MMQYRQYGKTGETVSALALGCMRFPLKEDGSIHEAEVRKMFDYVLDKGLNYIDTAWPYHGGESEPVVGRVLQGRREKVKLASKLPVWLLKTAEDMDFYLNQQLERLQTTYLDFYLVHALNRHTWATAKSLEIHKFLDKIQKDGRVRHVGFSFHDSYSIYEDILAYYDWSFCQIQLNYIDENYQAGLKGMHLASDRGMGVAVMEPLRGGKLVHNMPPEIRALFDSASTKRSLPGWALSYLWDKPEVSVVLSGMSNLEQLEENIALAEISSTHCLSQEDHGILQQAQKAFRSKLKVDCTACQYCMPCPFGVKIPDAFEYYNEASLFDRKKELKESFEKFYRSEGGPSACTKCGACLEKCPQNIAIPDELQKTIEYFGV